LSKREDRLVRCFASVFAVLSPDQIRTATVDTIPEWDSLASVTLVAVLEQEFGIQIDISDLPQLSSFGSIQKYLGKFDIPS
jgi:acyl carrier protein